MNEHTVLAKDLGSALLDVEVESLAEFIFQLIDHGVIAFKNRAGQLEESEMVRYGQEVLIHHNPLQLAYVKVSALKFNASSSKSKLNLCPWSFKRLVCWSMVSKHTFNANLRSLVKSTKCRGQCRPAANTVLFTSVSKALKLSK